MVMDSMTLDDVKEEKYRRKLNSRHLKKKIQGELSNITLFITLKSFISVINFIINFIDAKNESQ